MQHINRLCVSAALKPALARTFASAIPEFKPYFVNPKATGVEYDTDFLNQPIPIYKRLIRDLYERKADPLVEEARAIDYHVEFLMKPHFLYEMDEDFKYEGKTLPLHWDLNSEVCFFMPTDVPSTEIIPLGPGILLAFLTGASIILTLMGIAWFLPTGNIPKSREITLPEGVRVYQTM
eukprot:TRINITY_DN3438_c0_g1_i1.p1 TRINITY_DN3438_c0_g1~~TRINITY_DN3438_c0_g1_i1.p1  ORF type:complete len:185 (-),score=76.95 TRINITY_DN3438_c0_g1_i1:97-630(-)